MAKSLQQIIAKLKVHYGPPPAPITIDPFELILLENVAYLVSNEQRSKAFMTLRKHVVLAPPELLAASDENLFRATRLGGMHPEQRVERLRESALIALNNFGGDVKQILKMPMLKAKQELRKFPAIGEPSAEKILLFSRTFPLLSLDSNALRVLLRLGFGQEKKNYAASYRSVQEAISYELKQDYDWLIEAHFLLQQHGRELCKRTKPICRQCPLSVTCAYFNEDEAI